MPDTATRTVDGRQLRLTRLDKPLYPEGEFTKGEVLAYYEAVAPVLLPQLRDRVVTRIRYPDGTGSERFYERHAPRGMPDWIRRVTISASPGTGVAAKRVTYPVIGGLADLLWMANQGALELHTPQWHVGPRGGIGRPDRLVLDLDPGEGAGIEDCAEVARLLGDRLRAEGLEPVPATSGSKGIHVYAALDGRRTSLQVHGWVRDLARELAAAHPERIIATASREERAGKVFIDWSQNHPARSTATPYTLRGKARPTVAVPRTWDEIGPGLTQLGPAEVLARLERDGDLLVTAGLGCR
jgi:bifunctional non-homologous end joining protein LigD